METIVIKLNYEKLKNLNLDLCYNIPNRLKEYSMLDNGYDYLKDNTIGLWLKCDNVQEKYGITIEIFKKETFCNNDLSKGIEIYTSNLDCADLEGCKKVYP